MVGSLLLFIGIFRLPHFHGNLNLLKPYHQSHIFLIDIVLKSLSPIASMSRFMFFSLRWIEDYGNFLINHIWPIYEYCLVDPDCRNSHSIHFFQQCGFVPHQVIAITDKLGHSVNFQLMVMKKPNDLVSNE